MEPNRSLPLDPIESLHSSTSPPQTTTSHSAPSSPSLSPSEQPILLRPPPPGPPPLPPPPPPLPLTTSAPTTSTLPSFVGPLDALQRAALRQSKWPLILILPPTPTIHPGPHAPLHAPPPLESSIMLWRRVSTSTDAQCYTNFFPVDGLPHLALLDPRSGERLAVWGNDDAGMFANALHHQLWHSVLDDISHFLPLHSLKDSDLGPAHRADKPWAVRTRRVSRTPSASAQQSTTILDDEQAAIDAAIAASLADMESSDPSHTDAAQSDDEVGHDPDEEVDDDVDVDHVVDVDDDEEQENDDQTSNDLNSTTTDVESLPPATSSPMLTTPAASSPVPTRRLSLGSQQSIPVPMATPSSVESLSSSYLERMASCLRSSADPELAERRRLREQQDTELKEALLKDRAVAEMKQRAAAVIADAEDRLPPEPHANDETALCIALRLPDGKRLSRRFSPFSNVRVLTDLAVANGGSVADVKFVKVCRTLSSPGLDLSRVSWETPLSDLKLPKRSMFFLQA